MKIGDVAAAVGVDPPAIRFYEAEGIIPKPKRLDNGYRSYSDADVERLQFVILARSLDLSLGDIRQILEFRDQGEAPCSYVRTVMARQAETISSRISALERLQAELQRLNRLAFELPDTPPDGACICHIIQGHPELAPNH